MSALESLAAPAAAAQTSRIERNLRGVRTWLFAVAALVFAMVLVGGATRLTESGLSITRWQPVTGVVPPLSEADWRDEFARYQQIPQYAELNPDMTLDGFKTIFYWEWGHRLLARLTGLAFVLPLLWFWRKGRLTGRPVARFSSPRPCWRWSRPSAGGWSPRVSANASKSRNIASPPIC